MKVIVGEFCCKGLTSTPRHRLGDKVRAWKGQGESRLRDVKAVETHWKKKPRAAHGLKP